MGIANTKASSVAYATPAARVLEAPVATAPTLPPPVNIQAPTSQIIFAEGAHSIPPTPAMQFVAAQPVETYSLAPMTQVATSEVVAAPILPMVSEAPVIIQQTCRPSPFT